MESHLEFMSNFLDLVGGFLEDAKVLSRHSFDRSLDDGVRDDIKNMINNQIFAVERSIDMVHVFLNIDGCDIPFDDEPFNIYQVARDALRPMFSSSGNTISINPADMLERSLDFFHRGKPFNWREDPVIVLGNRKLTEIVLSNLFTNACKYGESRVDFDVEQGDGVFNVSVTNDYRGMMPENCGERLFEPGYRVLGTDKDGFGYGLFLVRKFVELQGGYVDVKIDRGSICFYFTLKVPDGDYG